MTTTLDKETATAVARATLEGVQCHVDEDDFGRRVLRLTWHAWTCSVRPEDLDQALEALRAWRAEVASP